MRAVLAVLVIFLVNPCWAQRYSKDPLYLVDPDHGIEAKVEYDITRLPNQKNLNVDAHIKQITLTLLEGASGKLNKASVYLNGQQFNFKCNSEANSCSLQTDEKNSELFSQNIFTKDGQHPVAIKDLFASFFINDYFWLKDPIRKEIAFKLILDRN